MSQRVLIVTFDPVTARMPGPAIRAWHMADVLSRSHDVVLASTVAADRVHPGLEVTWADDRRLRDLASRADVVVAQSSVVRRHPALAAAGAAPLVIDLYDPYHLENLEPSGRGAGADRSTVAHLVEVLDEDLRRGDFFLCASERQRDFWLGSLASLGRVNPQTYAADSLLRGTIDVVPFGIPEEPAQPGALGLRDRMGLAESDSVALWAGGVYNWLDPLSLLRALPQAHERVPSLKLIFVGMANPNPAIPAMRVAAEARELSDSLGLTGRVVHFNEDWVPYEERGGYLLDAAVGVSMHLDHLETRFSYRTRVLDYVWAGLPMVLTGGDSLADIVAAHGLGVVVPPGDPGAITDALVAVVGKRPPDAAFDVVRASMAWPVVLRPLLDFCASPVRSPDRDGAAIGAQAAQLSHGEGEVTASQSGRLGRLRLPRRRKG